MGAMAVVVAAPRPDFAPGVIEIFEYLGIEALVTEAPLKRFYEAIFRWLSGCGEVEFDAPIECPGVEGFRRELRAVVGSDDTREAPFGSPFEQLGDPCAGEAGSSLKHLT